MAEECIVRSGITSPKCINRCVTDDYAIFHGDCVKVAQGIPGNSLHFMVTSLPFVGLYNYTDSLADMSNVESPAQFFMGFDFLVRELQRCIMPGRLCAIHCMNIPLTIEHDGRIGIYDFRGDIIRAFEAHGFIFHSEVVIWKDPLVAATRTHALGLAHKQIVEDSSMCRMGIPDYLVVMRKPGDNPEPVSHKPSGFDRWIGPPEDEPKAERRNDPGKNKYSHYVWQNYASPVWMDIDPSDTLQRESAREESDSRHVCPLQKTVVRRAIELWSRPNDIIFDPYTGIGTTGWVAIGEGRRFVGAELKHSYYDQTVRNLEIAKEAHSQVTLDLREAEEDDEVPDWLWA